MPEIIHENDWLRIERVDDKIFLVNKWNRRRMQLMPDFEFSFTLEYIGRVDA